MRCPISLPRAYHILLSKPGLIERGPRQAASSHTSGIKGYRGAPCLPLQSGRKPYYREPFGRGVMTCYIGDVSPFEAKVESNPDPVVFTTIPDGESMSTAKETVLRCFLRRGTHTHDREKNCSTPASDSWAPARLTHTSRCVKSRIT